MGDEVYILFYFNSFLAAARLFNDETRRAPSQAMNDLEKRSVALDLLIACTKLMSASLVGRLGSSTFRLSTTAVSMSLTGSRFSSESAPRPFHYGIRGRGGTIFGSALP